MEEEVSVNEDSGGRDAGLQDIAAAIETQDNGYKQCLRLWL